MNSANGGNIIYKFTGDKSGLDSTTKTVNSGFKGMVQENAQPALSLSGLNNFKLPVPPLSEQQSIASYLDTKCAEIDALIAIKQAKIEELKEYKKSVIYEYVTGKKEVV